MTPRRWLTLLPLSVTCLAGQAETIHLRDRLGSVQADQISFETGGVRVMTVHLTSEPVQPSAESDEPVPPQPADPADRLDSEEVVSSDSTSGSEQAEAVFGRVLPWDQIRSIEGIEDPVLASEWNRWQPVADDLWRARARLQRGDRALSAPLFERHFDLVASDAEGSELGLIVAEGLLRSRLRSGAIEALIPAALETIRLRRAGYQTNRYQHLEPVLDEQLWIVPRLAPVRTREDLDSKSMRALLKPWIDSPDPVVAEIADAYARMHDPPDFLAEGARFESRNASGAALLSAAIATGAADPEQRAAARDRFDSLLRTMPAQASLDSWRGWFMGVSGLLDREGSLDLAILDLISIPALHLHRDPALSLRAIAVCADALENAGRTDEATVLRQEIERLDFKVAPALLPVDLGTVPSSSGVSSEEESR